MFPLCIYVGYVLDGRSFENYNRLICDTGHRSDFAANYGMPACLVNIGWVGLMFVFYLNLIMMFTEGAGYTGPTIGVVLAALTFTAMGQHPKNIWPILAGYLLLYLAAMLLCRLTGREIGWTISTQAFMGSAPGPPPDSCARPCVPPPARSTAGSSSTTAALPPASPP